MAKAYVNTPTNHQKESLTNVKCGFKECTQVRLIASEIQTSSRSSGRVRGGEKHEIYAAAFGGHLFYDLFLQGRGGMAPSAPWIRYYKLGTTTELFGQGWGRA